MAQIAPDLNKAILGAVGMTEREIEQNPARFIERYVKAGVAIIALRQRIRDEEMQS